MPLNGPGTSLLGRRRQLFAPFILSDKRVQKHYVSNAIIDVDGDNIIHSAQADVVVTFAAAVPTVPAPTFEIQDFEIVSNQGPAGDNDGDNILTFNVTQGNVRYGTGHTLRSPEVLGAQATIELEAPPGEDYVTLTSAGSNLDFVNGGVPQVDDQVHYGKTSGNGATVTVDAAGFATIDAVTKTYPDTLQARMWDDTDRAWESGSFETQDLYLVVNPITFGNLTGVEPGTTVQSGAETITWSEPGNVAATTTFSAVGSHSAWEYRINGGAWTPIATPAELNNNDTLELQVTTSGTVNQTGTVTIDIGGPTGFTWQVTNAAAANQPPVLSVPNNLTLSYDDPPGTGIPQADPVFQAWVNAATASDVEDGDLTGSITTNENSLTYPLLTANTPQTLTWSVTDSGGLTTQESRTVNAVATEEPTLQEGGGLRLSLSLEL